MNWRRNTIQEEDALGSQLVKELQPGNITIKPSGSNTSAPKSKQLKLMLMLTRLEPLSLVYGQWQAKKRKPNGKKFAM